MSSLGSQQTPNYQFATVDYVRSPEENTALLWGSFQGNGSSNPTAVQQRGNWFTVSRVSTGLYRVQLLLNVLATYSMLQNITTSGIQPGWPTGLLGEPFSWIVSESPQTFPAMAGAGGVANYMSVLTSRLDKTNTATLNTFDIQIAAVAHGSAVTGGLAVIDVTTADRVFFQLAYKRTGYTP